MKRAQRIELATPRPARTQRLGATAAGAGAIGALGLGGTALGALALGAVAVGAFAIGRLTVKRAQIGTLRIDRLELGEVARLTRTPRPANATGTERQVVAAEPRRAT